MLCGYTDDPKGIAPRGKYKQLFARNELKLTIINMLRQAPSDDEAIAAHIIAAKGWGDDVRFGNVVTNAGRTTEATIMYRIAVAETALQNSARSGSALIGTNISYKLCKVCWGGGVKWHDACP